MEIRLIAADMDGTLLDDEKKIPEENLRVFRECAARGIEIVPATGRTMRGLPDELRNLPGVHYAILTNGAQVVDLEKNEIIDSCRIPVALAEKIMMMARTSLDEIMYDVYIGGIGCRNFIMIYINMYHRKVWRSLCGEPGIRFRTTLHI